MHVRCETYGEGHGDRVNQREITTEGGTDGGGESESVRCQGKDTEKEKLKEIPSQGPGARADTHKSGGRLGSGVPRDSSNIAEPDAASNA